MANINRSDIKLLESERLTDFEDGGGLITANEIVDNNVNNLFDKKNRLDTTIGNVALRKCYPQIDTANAEQGAGSHAILRRPPQDPLVNVTLFSTEDWTDERGAAANFLESYVIQSSKSVYRLLGNQLQNQQSLQVYTFEDVDTPGIGTIFYVSLEGSGFTPAGQYVRVTDIASNTVQEFTESFGGSVARFYRRVISIEISTPLEQLFPAADPTQLADPAPTVLRDTIPAQIAEYHGICALADAASIGDLSVKVDDIFQPVVPASQSEIPIIDTKTGVDGVGMVATADSATLAVNVTQSHAVGDTFNIYFARPLFPGSLAFTFNSQNYTDQGDGSIALENGAPGEISGTVNYAGGYITITGGWSGSKNLTGTAKPAADVNMRAQTAVLPISIQNLALNYTLNALRPLPAPGALRVDYMAEGRWYTIRDKGNGELHGDGIGTVNYVTGSGIVTLLRQPDPGSALVVYWSSPVHVERRETTVTPSVRFEYQLAGDPPPILLPGSCSWSWTAGSVARTATDSDGQITGDASGSIDYLNGSFVLITTLLPDIGTGITFDYDETAGSSAGGSSLSGMTRDGGGDVDINLGANLEAGTVKIVWDYGYTGYQGSAKTSQKQVYDDGAGNLKSGQGYATKGVTIGTVNYTTGDCTFNAPLDNVTYYTYNPPRYVKTHTEVLGGGWHDTSIFIQNTELVSPGERVSHSAAQTFTGTGTAYFINSFGTGTTQQVVIGTPPVMIHVDGIGLGNSIVPNSVRFALGSRTYVDREGDLYYAFDNANGAGTLAGSINYSTGIMTLTDYPGGSAAFTMSNLLVVIGEELTVTDVAFRTAGAPVRPGSIFLRAVAEDTGELLTLTGDLNGDLSGDGEGNINYETGVVRALWGEEVDSEWVERPVIPSTMFYNAVSYTFLPLDPDILGLDAVRLPIDGKVLVLDRARVLVIHETTRANVGTPTGDQVLDAGHTDLADLYLEDSAGDFVLSSNYTADLAAGELTMISAPSLGGYTAPFFLVATWEDMVLCTEVLIDGTVNFAQQLVNDYSTAAFVSSALIMGDLQARVSKIFSQAAWTGVWSDEIIGSGTTGQFNDNLAPIVVLNADCIHERWRFVFATSTTVNVIGEYSGQILSNADITAEIAPVNPRTGNPYFIIDPAAWGGGWIAGNVVRINTLSANYPLWLNRTVSPGEPSETEDDVQLQIRLDSD